MKNSKLTGSGHLTFLKRISVLTIKDLSVNVCLFEEWALADESGIAYRVDTFDRIDTFKGFVII